jgi:prepilin-type N-terminal cleavage/methylation domain-containing protein/prepilin-type processing-associated H-X9-DG protein
MQKGINMDIIKKYTFSKYRATGFTLVELLVVISIIALLLSLLLPSLNKAREQARIVVCGSNQKQIVMAATMWAEENDGYCPPGEWYKPETYETEYGTYEAPGSLEPYLQSKFRSTGGQEEGKDGGVYACPSAKDLEFRGDSSFTADQRQFTYAMNGWICWWLAEGAPGPAETPKRPQVGRYFYGDGNIYWDTRGRMKLNNIRIPSDTAFFIDHEYYVTTGWIFNPSVPLEDDWRLRVTRWHKLYLHGNNLYREYGEGNIGWVDGHVSLEPDDFEKNLNDGNVENDRWKYYFYDH